MSFVPFTVENTLMKYFADTCMYLSRAIDLDTVVFKAKMQTPLDQLRREGSNKSNQLAHRCQSFHRNVIIQILELYYKISKNYDAGQVLKYVSTTRL